MCVFVGGSPAHGGIVIRSPDGRVFSRELYDGCVEFFFDVPGEWRVEFGGVVKKARVVARVTPTPSLALDELSGREAPVTGFAIFGMAPEWLALLLLLIALLAFLWYKLFYSVVRVRKTVVGKSVLLFVTNRRADLKNLVLTDFVSEEISASDYSEQPASVKETISGTVLVWRKGELKNGSTWEVKYSLSKELERVKPAELEAETASGAKIKASG